MAGASVPQQGRTPDFVAHIAKGDHAADDAQDLGVVRAPGQVGRAAAGVLAEAGRILIREEGLDVACRCPERQCQMAV